VARGGRDRGDRVAGVSGSPVPRRGLLLWAGAVTAAGLTGCDLDPTSSAPAAPPPPDPDQAIVTAARAELSELITRLGGAAATAPLVAVHRIQLAALQGEPPPVAAGRPPPSRDRIVARERRAADRFTRWASASANGDLARVLASVAAGIRMQPVLRDAS
jgi:hypothetical protein